VGVGIVGGGRGGGEGMIHRGGVGREVGGGGMEKGWGRGGGWGGGGVSSCGWGALIDYVSDYPVPWEH